MNESQFGLRHRPFPATPDLSCYYPAGSHERALERLLAGLSDGEGLLLLVGPPGTGKTLLCHALLDRLGAGQESVYLCHTRPHDRAGLLQAILFDLSLPHAGKTEQEMRLTLLEHLLQRYSAGQRTLLVIDEAQHLSADLLEELRLLSNLEGRTGKAVQIVLVGQPEVLDTLGAPSLGSFRQRLAVRASLEPLGVEEAADYLLHHLRAAGADAGTILGDESLELLARNTHGVPRLLNQAAHQAMRLAAMAGTSEIDVEAVLEALTLLGLPGAVPASASEEVLLVDPAASSQAETPEEAPADPCRLFTPGRSA
jgi:type II secretory pathway predicted ATPase ExeA